MHPRYKLAYFDQLKWPEEWKKVARDLVEEEWRAKYATHLSRDLNEPKTRASTPPRTPTQAGDSTDGDVEIEEDPGVDPEVEIDDDGDGDDGSALGDEVRLCPLYPPNIHRLAIR